MDQSILTMPAYLRSSICMVLNRWKTNRKIEQIAEATWKKL
jgi:hypothetical protein